jgi:hypothetical protein
LSAYEADAPTEPDDHFVCVWPLERPATHEELERIAQLAGDPPRRLTPAEVLSCVSTEGRA